MKSTQLTDRQAQLMESARELLQLSRSINPTGQRLAGEVMLPGHHVIHSATALAALVTGDISRWKDYLPTVQEIAKQEGIS